MKRRRLFWNIYPYYFVIIVVSLALTAFFGAREMRSMYTAQITTTLESRARLIAKATKSFVQSNDFVLLNHECREIARLSDSRVTIIDFSGTVLADSHEDAQSMENHGQRPEIIEAYGGEVGISTRFSNTLQTSMMYVAVPMTDEHEVIAVVRVSVPVTEVEETLASFYRNIIFGGLIILILAAIVSVALFRRLTIPLIELRDGASRFADGDFEAKLILPRTEEIADLAESMNSMAAQLDARIRTIAAQSGEREAILSSMSEGVLALDAGGKIVSLNRVAADLLGLDQEQSRGLAIYEALRLPSLLEFAELSLTSEGISEIEITLPGATEKNLQVRGAMLRDNDNNRVGTVLVFNDISRLKKLEAIKRDFVANVSHELKTPITAISGSIETLMDATPVSPEDSLKFYEIIARHSERLNNLVDDLLSLARLESEAEIDKVVVTKTLLANVMQASIRSCRESGIRHGIILECDCEQDLWVNVHPGQIEQAITNLITNAIKFSDTGSKVQVNAKQIDDEIVISVVDEGVGITEEHLPHLFERFYRVDKSRSRDAGGTGLGLAIVKHIVASHGGHVSVSSTVGKGSKFSIHLPMPQ